jgi:MFS family permease
MSAPTPDVSSDFARLALAVLLAKLALLAIDPNLRVFMGDSASYLHSALVAAPPPDRSFTYPWLIRASALAAGSGVSLLVVQTLIGAWSALLVAAVLIEAFGASPRAAAVAALIVALEPSQLLYERMLMAETAALAAMLAAIASLLVWCRTRRTSWIVAAALFGALAATLRTAWLPVATGLLVAGPVVLWSIGWLARRRYGRTPAVALLAGLGTLALALSAHSAWVERELEGELARHGQAADADAVRADGFHLLALMLPQVRPEHLADPQLPPECLATVRWPTDDLRYRELHRWAEGGLVHALAQCAEDPQALARRIALRAFRDDRLGFVLLGVRTWAHLFEPEELRHRILDDLGARAPPPDTRRWFAEALGVAVGRDDPVDTPVARAYVGSAAVLPALLPLLAALALILAGVAWRWRDPPMLALALVAGGSVASIVLFSPVATPRYLHALPALLVLALGALHALPRRFRRATDPSSRLQSEP